MPVTKQNTFLLAIITAISFSAPQVRSQPDPSSSSFPHTDLSCAEVEGRARSVMMGRVLRLSHSDLRRHMGKTQLDFALIDAVMSENVIHDFVGSHSQVQAFGKSWYVRCELSQAEG